MKPVKTKIQGYDTKHDWVEFYQHGIRCRACGMNIAQMHTESDRICEESPSGREIKAQRVERILFGPPVAPPPPIYTPPKVGKTWPKK